MRYLIKNALIEGKYKANVLIEKGKIRSISDRELEVEEAEVIKADGLWLLPGLVDLHVHSRVPGGEHKEDFKTLTEAALNGGYTHIVCMPNTDPPVDTPEMISYLYTITKNLPVNIFFTGTITKRREGNEIVEIGLMKKAGAVGFTDDGNWVKRADVMLNACIYARKFDAMLISHAEEPTLSKGYANYDKIMLKHGLKFRLPISEEIAVYRDCRLSELTNCHIHIAHVSSAGSVEIIKKFKEKGARVSAEITPHHLIFSTENIDPYDPIFRCNPPIRDEENRKKLVEALKDGVIDVVATDHAPHAYYEKERPIMEALPGIEGLETAFSSLYTHFVLRGMLSLSTLLDVMSYNPGRMLGVDNSIREGNHANFFLFDPKVKWKVKKEDILSKSKNNPFIGRELTGRVVAVFSKGKFLRR